MTLTHSAYMFHDIVPDVRDIPHRHEGRTAVGAPQRGVHIRLMREREIMSYGCQKHLHTDTEILKKQEEH